MFNHPDTNTRIKISNFVVGQNVIENWIFLLKVLTFWRNTLLNKENTCTFYEMKIYTKLKTIIISYNLLLNNILLLLFTINKSINK